MNFERVLLGLLAVAEGQRIILRRKNIC